MRQFMIIYNAEIYTMEKEGPIQNGYVAFDREKILKVGSGDEWKSAFAGEETVDAKGARVYPGFIDAHSHLGLFDDGLTDEGSDGIKF